MGLGDLGQKVALGAARRLGRRARKYLAPVAPFIVGPVALGAGLSAGALALFFNLADDIRQTDGVWRFDHSGLEYALTLRNPRRTALAKFVSAAGRPDVMTYVGLASLAAAWRVPRYRPQGILMAVSLAGGGGLIALIKVRYARGRPTLIEALAQEGSFSFPSGHSFGALIFYGVLTFWWIQSHKSWLERLFILGASVQAVALIGASRVYLGVHYPSDVLAGYAAAVPWLTACLTGYSQYERRKRMLPQPLRAGLEELVEGIPRPLSLTAQDDDDC